MALTPAGATTPYCTVQDILVRADYRTVGDYLGPSSAGANEGQRLTLAQITTSGTAGGDLYKLMQEASGEFESRLSRGERYQAADIQAMVAQAGNGAQVIAGIVAGWTLLLVWQRRPTRFAADDMPLHARLAGEKMEALSSGEAILPFLEAEEAGLEAHHVEDESDVVTRNGAATIARRMFGKRGRDIGDRGTL